MLLEMFFANKELTVFLISMIPLIELRGGILMGVTLGISPLNSLLLAYVGSTLMIPFIYYLLLPILRFSNGIKPLKSLVNRIMEKATLKKKNIGKYKLLGLAIFVAIPLPGTGVWMGTFLGSIMKLSLKKTFVLVATGNLVAGIIISLLGLSMTNIVEKVV